MAWYLACHSENPDYNSDVEKKRSPSLFRFHPLWGSCLAIAVLLAVSGGPPGFRDGVHFYGPLFEYLCQECVGGRLPLWNPYENIGQPLAASPTTLFFYPGTLFAIAVVRLGNLTPLYAYTAFTTVHLFLALLTAYRLARAFGGSREAACFAALAYTLGGAVLFQWNNLPFLVGAAWFPESLRQAERLFRWGRTRNLLGLSITVSLMILGGDPQAAVHAAICMFVLLSCRARTLRSFFRSFKNLLFAAFLTFCLTGIQVLPALELALLSDRTLGTHGLWVYWFSVPPWRLIEFFWPGAGGWQFPLNARWFSAFTSENGIWTPSLYMGLLPCLSALLSFSGRRKLLPFNRWSAVTFLLLFFALGSLGNWFCVYTLLDRLPGYAMFRYPGKLMTVAGLMLALLAARGFDRLRWDEPLNRRFRFLLRIYAVAALLVATVVYFKANIFPQIPDCPLFGPFVPDQARFGLLFSAMTVFIVACAAGIRRSLPLLLALTALDLGISNAWMLAPQSADFQRIESPLLSELKKNESAPIRVYRYPLWYPPEFQFRTSRNRLAESADWDRRSLLSRHPLPLGINMMDVRGTLMPKAYYPLAGRLRRELAGGGWGEFEKHLARLGVHYVVAPENVELDADRLFLETKSLPHVSFWKIRAPAPREFILYEPNRIVFDVEQSEAGTHVVSEQYWPGWHAFLESGEEIPVRPVEDVFRGVDLPPGKHRVTMIYDPFVFKLGTVLSLFGLLLTAVISMRATS